MTLYCCRDIKIQSLSLSLSLSGTFSLTASVWYKLIHTDGTTSISRELAPLPKTVSAPCVNPGPSQCVSLHPHQHVFLTVCLPPSTPTRLSDSVSPSIHTNTSSSQLSPSLHTNMSSSLSVSLPPHQHVFLTVCLPPSTPTRLPHCLSPSLHTNTSSSLPVSLPPHQHVFLTVCLPPSTPTRPPHSLSPSFHTNTSSSQSVSLPPHQHVFLTVCLPPSTPTRLPHCLSPSLHTNTSSSLSVSLPPHQHVFLTTLSLPPHQHVLLTVCLPPSTPTRPPHSLPPSIHINTSSSQSVSLLRHQHALPTVGGDTRPSQRTFLNCFLPVSIWTSIHHQPSGN